MNNNNRNDNTNKTLQVSCNVLFLIIFLLGDYSSADFNGLLTQQPFQLDVRSLQKHKTNISHIMPVKCNHQCAAALMTWRAQNYLWHSLRTSELDVAFGSYCIYSCDA